MLFDLEKVTLYFIVSITLAHLGAKYINFSVYVRGKDIQLSYKS